MGDMATDRSSEPSAFGWIFSGLVGVLALGGITRAIFSRRASSQQQAASVRPVAEQTDTPDGHPS